MPAEGLGDLLKALVLNRSLPFPGGRAVMPHPKPEEDGLTMAPAAILSRTTDMNL